MVPTNDEKAWIQRSQNGDHAAFEALVRNYQHMVHSVTFRMTGSLADAEDLAQESFIRAFRQIETYRGDAKFSSWLCRVTVNVCLNWRKRESRREQVYESWANETLNSSSANPSESAMDELSRRVQGALDRLPAKQRAAIILTTYEAMNHAEAARVLGCTEATVSWRVFAARNKLKCWLKPAGGTDG